MPNRILREGILSSERVNALSAEAEVFYRRLMSVVDDFGRYSAHPTLLRSRCYPLAVDRIAECQISEWLRECDKARLVVVYEHLGKPYLQLDNFGQQQRAKESKFPAPLVGCSPVRASAIKCEQAQAPESGSVAEYADRMYNRHPRLQDRLLVEQKCVELWAKGGRELLERIEKSHSGWCESEEWKREGGRFVPSLYRWLCDSAWVREAPKARGGYAVVEPLGGVKRA